MRTVRAVLGDAWRLTLPYFRSEEKWSARLMLLLIISMNFSLVGLTVVLNYWNGAFYDSLQNKDWDSFINLLLFYRSGEKGFMIGFTPIVCVLIPVSIYRTYLRQWLQIRWRRWMTERMLSDWLADRAYYTLSLTRTPSDPGTDNPDQRISDDIQNFTENTLQLGLGLLSQVVSLFNFAVILWTLSGAYPLFGIHVPGYMLWVAIVYSIIGTFVTHYIGRPLAALYFAQQRLEADFRYALVRVRENQEGIALYHGETQEKHNLLSRFSAIVSNFFRIMSRTRLLSAIISGYEQIASIFPYVVAAPRYFAGEIQLGGLTRTGSAFGKVQASLSWFVESYATLAEWRATVDRLASFSRAIVTAQALAETGVAIQPGTTPDVRMHSTTLALPDGRVLLDHGEITFPAHQNTAITGRSGTGKSTLFRALAGIWPFGSGVVERPAGTSLFLPQRPYIPLGTLRQALTYPAATDSLPEAALVTALETAGLGSLAAELDHDEHWDRRLSGGEQQRLAVARALLLKPDWLYLDEATASLDPEAATELYDAIKQHLPGTTVISIAHRPEIAALHDQVRVFERKPSGPGTLVARQPETTVSTARP